MPNKKRDRSGYVQQLGRYRLSRTDIRTIEKLLWEYADAREMKYSHIAKLPDGRRHMPRRFVDRYASAGRYSPFHLSFGWNEVGVHFAGVDWIYREDSPKFLARYIKRTRYLELAAWPGIKVTFTPFTTTIYAQTHYATGKELMAMKKVVASIEDYLNGRKLSLINMCNLRK